MPSSDKPVTEFVERQYSQVNESIASLIELTTRVDERVRNMLRQQEICDDKIDDQSESFNELNTRVKILESDSNGRKTNEELHKLELRLQVLENSNNSQENRWKTIFSFAIQLVWVILAAYVLFKLGISSPPVP